MQKHFERGFEQLIIHFFSARYKRKLSACNLYNSLEMEKWILSGTKHHGTVLCCLQEQHLWALSCPSHSNTQDYLQLLLFLADLSSNDAAKIAVCLKTWKRKKNPAFLKKEEKCSCKELLLTAVTSLKNWVGSPSPATDNRGALAANAPATMFGYFILM